MNNFRKSLAVLALAGYCLAAHAQQGKPMKKEEKAEGKMLKKDGKMLKDAGMKKEGKAVKGTGKMMKEEKAADKM